MDVLHLIRGLKDSRNEDSTVLQGWSLQGILVEPSPGVQKPPSFPTSSAQRGSGVPHG